ncbi:hypothetical protein HPB47_016201, partial [Ixodes persulcatus]
GSNDNSPKSRLSRDGFLPSIEQDLRLHRMYVPPMVKCEIKKQWQNLKSRSRAELTLSKKADSTTGRNDYRLTPLAEAVLAVVGTTSPNLLGIEGGIDTDQ